MLIYWYLSFFFFWMTSLTLICLMYRKSMLQALQYLLKLCSHPLLVLGEKIPDSVASLLSESPGSTDMILELHKPRHSPKLVALQEILEECGIGVDASNSETSAGVGQHRVLIFAQHKVRVTLIIFFKFCDFLLNFPHRQVWHLM